VPAPASPLLRPPTTSSAKLLTFYAGADKLFDHIRRKAFEIFQKNGSVHGHDVEHWLEAERECICCPESQLVYKDGQFEISVTTPGSEPKDLQVAVLPDSIIVSRDVKKDADTHSSESSERVLFSRVTLPEPIDVNSATARLEKVFCI
jgi:HSP20 family molecular chaperone IbpA